MPKYHLGLLLSLQRHGLLQTHTGYATPTPSHSQGLMHVRSTSVYPVGSPAQPYYPQPDLTRQQSLPVSSGGGTSHHAYAQSTSYPGLSGSSQGAPRGLDQQWREAHGARGAPSSYPSDPKLSPTGLPPPGPPRTTLPSSGPPLSGRYAEQALPPSAHSGRDSDFVPSGTPDGGAYAQGNFCRVGLVM